MRNREDGYIEVAICLRSERESWENRRKEVVQRKYIVKRQEVRAAPRRNVRLTRTKGTSSIKTGFRRPVTTSMTVHLTGAHDS
jgi:hypothetical protein